MDTRVAHVLGTVWGDSRPWEVLTHLAEFEDRLGGHPGEQRAAAMLSETFETLGLDGVETRPFGIPVWTRGETSLLVHVYDRERERSFEAQSLPYCPEATAEGPLVDVGYGTPAELHAADVKGAIAVASTATPPAASRFYHRMEKVGHAADAGAKGFVFANHREGQLPPTGALRAGESLPAVGVSYETGEWLRSYAGQGAAVRLNVTSSVAPGTSQNVVGRVGPETDREVLVLAHYDAHDIAEGALDNGCGVATLVGVASALAALAEEEAGVDEGEADREGENTATDGGGETLARGVRFAAVGCEELGLQGSETLAARLDTDDIHAVVNLDGVGRDRTVRALTQGSSGVREVVESVFESVDHPLQVDPDPHPYSDHWPFLRAGVPAVQLHSRAEADEGHWDRGWTHTRADTRDKADVRTIREHVMLATLLVRALAAHDLDRVDTDHLRETLADAEPSIRAAGMWPDGWKEP